MYAYLCNGYLQVHVDSDFTYGAVLAHTATDCALHDSVVVYFAFPRLGVAIPLRPGDLLFFNPKEPHCVSSRCKTNDDVHVVSLYLRSSVLGLNDNSKALNETELLLLENFNHMQREGDLST